MILRVLIFSFGCLLLPIFGPVYIFLCIFLTIAFGIEKYTRIWSSVIKFQFAFWTATRDRSRRIENRVLPCRIRERNDTIAERKSSTIRTTIKLFNRSSEFSWRPIVPFLEKKCLRMSAFLFRPICFWGILASRPKFWASRRSTTVKDCHTHSRVPRST